MGLLGELSCQAGTLVAVQAKELGPHHYHNGVGKVARVKEEGGGGGTGGDRLSKLRAKEEGVTRYRVAPSGNQIH